VIPCIYESCHRHGFEIFTVFQTTWVRSTVAKEYLNPENDDILETT